MVRHIAPVSATEQVFEIGDRVRTAYGQIGRVSAMQKDGLLIALDCGGFISVRSAEVQRVASAGVSFSRHVWMAAPARPDSSFYGE